MFLIKFLYRFKATKLKAKAVDFPHDFYEIKSRYTVRLTVQPAILTDWKFLKSQVL
jgi:hypothetical protein